MSCWRKHVVLRIPAKTFGIWLEAQWERFEKELDDQLEEGFTWRPGSFAPALCDWDKGFFLDYMLEDTAPMDSEFESIARPLTREEAEQYLPAFREVFPQFSMREMADVHYCAYVWYDENLAQSLY